MFELLGVQNQSPGQGYPEAVLRVWGGACVCLLLQMEVVGRDVCEPPPTDGGSRRKSVAMVSGRREGGS